VLGVGVIYPILFMRNINLSSFLSFQMSARRKGMRFARKMSGNQSARTSFDFFKDEFDALS
jgi:hypothetical protein